MTPTGNDSLTDQEAHAADGAAPFEAIPTPGRTHGVSPKLWAALISAVGTYLVTQTLLELPALVVVAIQALIIAASVWRAGPGDVTPAD